MNASNVVTDLSNISNIEGCCSGASEHQRLAFNNGINQNGGSNSNGAIISGNGDESRRHNSMDRLMGLLNDMGRVQRTRSLSDGGQEDGKLVSVVRRKHEVTHFAFQPKKRFNLIY